jgi:putative inorganic carbon (HCO3(-)) transporter
MAGSPRRRDRGGAGRSRDRGEEKPVRGPARLGRDGDDPRPPVEWLLPWMPLVALIPNVFVIPDLTYPGLATQELVAALAVVALVGLALADLSRPGPAAWDPDRASLRLALLAWLLWQILATAWAPDPAEAWRVAGIGLALVVLLGLGTARLSLAAGDRLLVALVVVSTVLASLQLFEYVWFGGPLYGILFNHGLASEALALMLPVHTVVALSERRPALVAATLAATALSVAALVATLRRGPLAGAVLAGAVVALLVLRGRVARAAPRRLAAVAGLVMLAAVPLALREREAIAVRLEGATRLEASELGLRSRAKTWAVAWELATLHPWRGVGTGGYAARYADGSRLVADHPRYAAITRAAEPEDGDEVRSPLAHSEYLQVLAELGWVGLGLFLAVWGLVVRALLASARMGSARAWGAVAGLLAFAVSSGVSAFSVRFTPGTLLVASVVALGLADPRVGVEGPRDPWGATPMRRRLAAGVLAILLMAAGLAAWRAHRVFLSQRAQGQLDFRVGRDASTNEALRRRYRDVLAWDPWNGGAQLGLALLQYQVGPASEAVTLAEEAYRHGYGRPFGCLLLAFAYERAGRPGDAVALSGGCAAAFPRSVVTGQAHAALLDRQGASEAARRERTRTEALDIRLARSWALALRLRRPAARSEAAASGLVPPDQLTPTLVRGLVQARAFHVLD